MWCTAAVCWRVLQHWSVVKLVVLHRVIREEAPAHTQGCLGGRVGYLRVDYWGRWSCWRNSLGYKVILVKAVEYQKELTLQTPAGNRSKERIFFVSPYYLL